MLELVKATLWASELAALELRSMSLMLLMGATRECTYARLKVLSAIRIAMPLFQRRWLEAGVRACVAVPYKLQTQCLGTRVTARRNTLRYVSECQRGMFPFREGSMPFSEHFAKVY